jgi:uncharacterized protein (TIGR02466 family)
MDAIYSLEMTPIFPTMIGKIARDDMIDDEIIISSLTSHWKQDLKELVNQTHGSMHKLEEFSSLNNFILDGVRQYLRHYEYEFKDEDLYIASCWANYSTGIAVSHNSHTHSNSLMSAVYYLSAPEGSAYIVFEHPNALVNALDPYYTNHNTYNSTSFKLQPKKGGCVIFKSTTKHYTAANKLNPNEKRMSVGYTLNLHRLGSITNLGNYE